MDGLFEGAEVISTYTDAQALDDGVLVDVRGVLPAAWNVNRATRALWSAYTETIGGVMTNITRFVQAMKAAWSNAREDDGWRIGTAPDGQTVWFVPNEVGGMTAMFPEDY